MAGETRTQAGIDYTPLQMDEKHPWIHATACKVTPGDIIDQVPSALLSPFFVAVLTTS
jgi:hypothetical protein